MKRCLLAAAMAALLASYARGQDSLLTDGLVLATFRDARSLGVDPAGRIYVADAGRHAVRIMDRQGRTVFELGGAGTEEAEFDEPRGVDPTNGLAIVVADAGNSRLKRFTRSYQLIESIRLYGDGPDPVGAGSPSESLVARGAGRALPVGRPIAVAVSRSNEIFAVDELQSAVGKWNASRQFVGFIGAENDFVRLKEPVDIEVLGDLVMVADRRLQSIAVYDQFGGYVTEFGGGRLVGLSGLYATEELVAAAFGSRVAFFDRTGMLLGDFPLPVRRPVRDVALLGDRLLVLTERELIAFPLPSLAAARKSDVDPQTERR